MMTQDARPSSSGGSLSSPDADPSLYDEFQAQVRNGADVSAWIERAAPAEGGLDAQLAQLTTLKSWLDSFRPLPAAVVEELRQYYTVSLTYNSNAIEGNTLTQHETEMVLAQGVTVGGKTLVEHLEVIGHRDAMEYMEQLAQVDTPLGEWEIKSLHSLILQPVDGATGHHEAGRYRTLDVRAAGTDYMYPPHYRVPELMQTFSRWLQAEATQALHPVERAALAHYQLVTTHPLP